MHLHKKIALALIAAVIVLLLALSFRAEPVPVMQATVQRGPLQVLVEEEGRTRVRERYVISTPVTAYSPRIEVHVGDAVKQGQVLLRLQPSPSAVLDARARAEAQARVSAARAALSAEEARLRAAQADATLAQRELERTQPLVKEGTLPERSLDQARADVQRTAATVRSTRAAVDVARHDLHAASVVLDYSAAGAGEQVEIASPVDGRILSVEHESQRVVMAGQPIMAVGDPASLEVEVEVLSADAVRLRPGMRVLFQRWGGEQPLEGRVRVIEPEGFTKTSALGVEEQRVKVIADITTPFGQWQSLGDAYRVEAQFVLWEAADVLKVPSSALFRDKDGWAVFVVSGGRARLTRVKPGQRGALESQVLEGVEPGQIVIAHPDNSLRDGDRVTRLKAA